MYIHSHTYTYITTYDFSFGLFPRRVRVRQNKRSFENGKLENRALILATSLDDDGWCSRYWSGWFPFIIRFLQTEFHLEIPDVNRISIIWEVFFITAKLTPSIQLELINNQCKHISRFEYIHEVKFKCRYFFWIMRIWKHIEFIYKWKDRVFYIKIQIQRIAAITEIKQITRIMNTFHIS